MQPNKLSQQFAELSALLHQTKHYWRPVAFHHAHLGWMEQHSGLLQRLYTLSPQQIEHLATDAPALTAFMVSDLPLAHELAQLSTVAMLPQNRATHQVTPHFYAGIPGRKWQQVEAFAHKVKPDKLPILEWCAGKSHLGFYLQQCSHAEVTALEWDEKMVQNANARALSDDIALHSHTLDVLSDTAENFIKPEQQIVALHACGELHERLLRLSVEKQVQRLHIAPCCYHKRREEIYTPLSKQGRDLDLHLNKAELHTAVMETATAGATIKRQRINLQIMRLGFDYLQKDLRATDEFLRVPSLTAKWGRASFADFCEHCAQLKNITLPASVNWQHYLQLGEQRFWQVSALDLVRFLFRRPLEIWLALDRALLLQEHGYSVELGTFCSAKITPRNILLQAYLP